MFSAATKSAHPSGSVNWIDDVFSTYLYTGNGSSTTVVNGIDTSTKGGLIWVKKRSGVQFNILQDTARGAGYLLYSNATTASGYDALSATTFTTDGFITGSDNNVNASGSTYASWTFRKQAKFFDVVTYTGDGAGSRGIDHNLGSVPAFVIIKATSTTADWAVMASRSSGNVDFLKLNTTAASYNADVPNPQNSTKIWVGGDDGWSSSQSSTNVNGVSYVAYIYASNAGGFGTAGTDNVISCGSFADSAGATVNLGYEPQWVLIKSIDSVSDWYLLDNMRGFDNSGMNRLEPNLSSAEVRETPAYYVPTATGFKDAGGWLSGSNCIYIAIRRPMKPPTSGTSVFNALISANSTTPNYVSNTVVDLGINRNSRTASGYSTYVLSRLQGAVRLLSDTTDAEAAFTPAKFDYQNGYYNNSSQYTLSPVTWMFTRASGFFDVVCYTGNGSDTNFTHNLGVAPEMMIVKSRNATYDWAVYSGYRFGGMNLNSTAAQSNDAGWWANTAPTSSVFTVGNSQPTNNSGTTYVAYLFASCPGVSKVGSYTGTGGTFTVNCGFTGGARFVLIKRTDSTGDWYVWDTARGMVAGTDPRLTLNSQAASSNANWVYTDTTGFQVVGTDASINANGGSYIYLAIA